MYAYLIQTASKRRSDTKKVGHVLFAKLQAAGIDGFTVRKQERNLLVEVPEANTTPPVLEEKIHDAMREINLANDNYELIKQPYSRQPP
jgi:hypothetical protein